MPAKREQTHVYRVLTGISYRPRGDRSKPERRAEPGEVVDDLPAQSVGWLERRRAVIAVDTGDQADDDGEEV